MNAATPEELEKYDTRAYEYDLLARRIETLVGGIYDLQVRAAVATYANECRETAERWRKEKQGGL